MRTLFIFIILFTSCFVWGQDSLQRFELDEVVVTGEVEPQSAKQSVYQVRTIPMERIQAQGSTRLQDVLSTELNMRFSQDPALGESNFDMLGLSGQNIKILIDGVPIVGRQGVRNEININQINVNSIERIEIVEGPMSVIYGADALAGVINIITKKAGESKLDISATIHEESIGSEYGMSKGIHNESVSFGYNAGSIYFSGNINRNDFQGTAGDSIERKMQWLPKMQWLGGGLVGYKADKWDAYYRADYLHEKIYSPDRFVGTQAIDQNFITQRLMHQLQLNVRLSKKLNYNAAFSYTDFKRRTQTIVVDKATGRETLAVSELQKRNSFNGLTLRGTFQYKFSDVFTLQPGYDINIESGTGERLQEGDNIISDYAAFISADLKITPFINLRPGLRVVRNTSYEAPPVIPSLNTKFVLSEKHDIRVSYGRGFRAPSIRELYFNFIDASHSIEGNPELEAELS
ncbi:MAG TPA: TonB-dependent receptor, partial [Ohtaekwangia sp.]|nr:TonB-dependent receptor [Ohtaekwangia sp.]